MRRRLKQGPRLEPFDRDPADDGDEPVVEAIQKAEDARNASQRSAWPCRISTTTVTSSCLHYGIGTAPKSVSVQAAWLVVSPSRVINIRLTAERQLRERLLATG